MTALTAVDWAERLVLAALAVVTVRRWVQHRRGDLGRVALTFVALALLSLVGLLRPVFASETVAGDVLARVSLALLALFPWLLWRVAADLHPYRRSTRRAISTITAVVVVVVTASPIPEATGSWPLLPGLVLALQWTTVAASAAVGLWRAGRQLPRVACLRVRTVAAGASLLAVAVPLLGLGPSARPVVHVVVLLSAMVFYVGFSPPPGLRVLWRQRAVEDFRAVERELLSPTTPEDVAATILPHAARLTGSSLALLADEDGVVWAVEGGGTDWIGRRLEGLDDGGAPGGLHGVRLRSGWLAVRPSQAAPMFRREELALLASLGHALDMALTRARERAAMRETERQLVEAQELAGIGSYSWDPVTGEAGWSSNFWRLLGYRPEEVTDPVSAFLDRVHPGDLDAVAKARRRLISAPAEEERLFRALVPDRGVRWFHSRSRSAPAPGGSTSLMGTIQDVTDQLEIDAELRARAGRQAAVASLSQEALTGADMAALTASAAAAAAELLGLEHVAVLEPSGAGDEVLVTAGIGVGRQRRGERVAAAPDSTVEGRCLALIAPVVGDDHLRAALAPADQPQSAVAVALPGQDGPRGALVVYDIAERSFGPSEIDFLRSIANVLAAAMERSETHVALAQQAFCDELTGLANRHRFIERLRGALERTAGRGEQVAVLFCDLDRFKVVNDALGHSAGDRLLRAVAERFGAALRSDDVLARFGGDEFVVLAAPAGWDDADALARRLAQSLEAPVLVGSRPVRVTVSIGVVVVDGGTDPETVLRDADAAMYRAKDRGRDRAERFDAELRRRTVERIEVEAQLREALAGGELVLHYQPELDLASDRPVGVEALVRWRHPTRGLLAPDQFLPVAEEAGMMIELGEWVFEEACRQTAEWRASGAVDVDVLTWVNLSAAELTDQTLPARVAAVLERTGAQASWLGVEITERALMEELDTIVSVLAELRALGFQLAIDDIGTGFSSLSYLKRFPVGFLKIDREFVSGITTDAGDAAIVRAVVDLAHGLGLQAIAEGVETQEQVEVLRTLGCDVLQGYGIGRPVDAAGVVAALGPGMLAVS